MVPAPEEIGGLPVLWFTPIDDRHRPTGKCRHVSPGGLLGPARGLAICGRPGESVYLHSCDADWVPFTDTWHETAEEAKRQAAFEYEGFPRHGRPRTDSVEHPWGGQVEGTSIDLGRSVAGAGMAKDGAPPV